MKYQVKHDKTHMIDDKLYWKLSSNLWRHLYDNTSPHLFSLLDAQITTKLFQLWRSISKVLTPNIIKL